VLRLGGGRNLRVVPGVVVARDGVLAGRLLEGAFVDVELAGGALPGGWAVAAELVPAVDAEAAVEAGLGGALVDVGGAVRAGEALGAVAYSALADLGAARPVEAGVGRAGVVDLLAGRAGEALRAGAAVLIRGRVLAGAAVLTGLVGPAVVEVLVAEDATPVRVADALPARAVAVAVLAARVGCALVAELTPPAVTALALPGDVAVAVHRVAALLAHRWNNQPTKLIILPKDPRILAFIALPEKLRLSNKKLDTSTTSFSPTPHSSSSLPPSPLSAPHTQSPMASGNYRNFVQAL
jgi:hypothetical protein